MIILYRCIIAGCKPRCLDMPSPLLYLVNLYYMCTFTHLITSINAYHCLYHDEDWYEKRMMNCSAEFAFILTTIIKFITWRCSSMITVTRLSTKFWKVQISGFTMFKGCKKFLAQKKFPDISVSKLLIWKNDIVFIVHE